jgi:hypothetical protein
MCGKALRGSDGSSVIDKNHHAPMTRRAIVLIIIHKHKPISGKRFRRQSPGQLWAYLIHKRRTAAAEAMKENRVVSPPPDNETPNIIDHFLDTDDLHLITPELLKETVALFFQNC